MKKLIDITIVLDRSGSMESIVNETIVGYNNFLSSQRLIKGEACISLVQFDHEYNKVYTGLDIQKAPFLNRDTYVPRGLTAFLDAIGLTIRSIRKRLKSNCNTREPELFSELSLMGMKTIVATLAGKKFSTKSASWKNS